ncbi:MULTISPECIES: PAS domain-containing sensor histidine kinase [unclassified Massilia]|uniref:hybrid sensor histidine kinase/response regulator n=1 Tax=unclassified Massilia TaxID=2609279 RepID=UPI001780D38C|nr:MULTISPECIES: PAS domain-containing sensor histidine kinase [unclassified Massilia]MBD8532561.1 PAS domain S-box protein [Massilia sp. CFBP 13647]MBD8672949.1 PAS domain S-box protein [Massilia sp. CFBP 13721]
MNNRIAAKKKLTEEQRFQYLISGISDYAIYMLDPDGHVSSWNTGAQRFKGYQAPEILGEHFSRFYTPEDRATNLPERALATALVEGKYEAEGWRMRQDGTRFWASVVIDPIYDEQGTLLGYAKITRDITDKRQAEQALRASEERFRLLVQGVTDYAIYMLSPEGTVTNWNVGAERIKGYSYDEIVGRHFSTFYTEEDRAAGLPARALGTAACEGRYESEGWRLRKEGTRFWAHVVIDAIRDDMGELIGFAKITRDLTEKKKADAALAEANLALFQAQKMESIGQLTGGIAHDFNNLLSVLASGLEVLSLGRGGNADAKTLDSMRRAIDRGATLTQQLLAFARQQPLQPETRSVNRLISGFESVLRRAVNAAIDFHVRLDPHVRNTVIDSARFESAILNLVVNARDAMPDGGSLQIETANVDLVGQEVRGLAPGPYVRVTVTDTGTGMSPETAARAFEPFYTTKEVGKGTGLGLSQVYGFIKQSGGEVVIGTTPGEGTAISIFLPAAPGQDGETARKDSLELVLIVEDEPDLMDVASALFISMGYEVVTASDANEALNLLGGRAVDILFSDIIMPHGMNGVELANHTRQHYPEVKIILASGYPLPALVLGDTNLEDFAFVNKPYRLSDLARALRTAV